MREIIEGLIVLGLLGLLILLRLDAPRFGVAEYDDSGRSHGWRAWVRRLAWFVLGIALVLVVYWLYPQPISILHLDIGGSADGADRGRAMLYGLIIAAGGIAAAAVFAWGRYGGIRLPAPGAYPGAFVNSVGTAIVDEATFRGILLGLLLQLGLGQWVAIGIAAVVYGVATRLAARGRSKGMLLIDVLLAVIAGWTVIETGGIGAAILGHAITRFAIFLLTGHTDQSRPFTAEPESVATRALPPKGWDLAGRSEGTRPWTTHVVGAEMGIPANVRTPGPSYAGESPFAGQGYQQAVPMGPQAPMGPQPGYPPPVSPYTDPQGYPEPGGYREPAGYPAPAGYPEAEGYPEPAGYPEAAGYPPGPAAPEGQAPWPPQEPWNDLGPGGYVPAEGMPPPPPEHLDDQGGGQRG